MKIDIEKWISLLPVAEEQAAEGSILFSGMLLPGKADEICILSGALRLSFSQDDILKIESSPVEGYSIVAIRQRAPVLESMPSELCDLSSLSKRRPFALSVRSRKIISGPSHKFRALERQFLADEALLKE
jgi:hypothetical protein